MGTLKFVIRGIGFVRLGILARILPPVQFGIFGIAGLILVLLEKLTETGINVFLIQEDSLEEYIDTAFIVSIIRGIIGFAVILLLSPLITLFFKEPLALASIVVISFVPLVRGFINPSVVKFKKELDFKKDFLLRAGLFLVDALVAVVFSIITKSAVGMVLGLLVSAIVEVFVSHVYISPKPKFAFNKLQFKTIIGRGKWVTGSGILEYLSTNVDDLVVGRVLGTVSLGYYQVAYKLSELPLTEVSQVVGQVAFPVYSKIVKDKKRLKSSFIRVFVGNGAVGVLLGIFVFLFSGVIVEILLGPAWREAVGVVRVLAIFGIIKALVYPVYSLFFAVRRQDLAAKLLFVTFLALAVVIYPLTNVYGLFGAGYSAIISVVVSLPFGFYYTRKVFR